MEITYQTVLETHRKLLDARRLLEDLRKRRTIFLEDCPKGSSWTNVQLLGDSSLGIPSSDVAFAREYLTKINKRVEKAERIVSVCSEEFIMALDLYE